MAHEEEDAPEAAQRAAAFLSWKEGRLVLGRCLIIVMLGLLALAASGDSYSRSAFPDRQVVIASDTLSRGTLSGEARTAADAQHTPPVAFTSFRMRNWTVDDGLLGRASGVAQTPDGYLWGVTDQGLFRFDGARFVGFTTGTVPTFRSDDFSSVDVLPSGDLWIGAKDQWTYRLRAGTWTAHRVPDVDWVFGIVQDGDGTVWASGSRRTLARFDSTGWVPLVQKKRDVWAPLAVDADGVPWTYLDTTDAPGRRSSFLSRYGGVVARWDGTRFTPVADERLFGFEQTQHGPLFHHPVDADPASLAEMLGLRIQLTDADGTYRGAYPVTDVPRSAHLIDRAGRVWTEPIISDGTLTVFDGDVAVVRIRPEGARWIERLYEDRQGNVWVLSSGGGLLQVTPEPFRRFSSDEGAPLSAESAIATATGEVLVSARGSAENAALFVAGGASWSTSIVRPGAAALPLDDPDRVPTVGMVTEDGHGRRFGTHVNRLVRLNGDRGTNFWESPSPHTLQVLFPDPAHPNALWVGAGPKQVVRVDTETLLATDSIRIPLPVSGPSWTMDVHRTPDGRLWIASRGGLVVVENGVARPVEALAGVPVRDLITGPDGSLWAATETRGLVRLRNGALDVVGLEAGLPTTHLISIILDDLGFAWINGRSLLYRVRTADLERAFDATTPVSIDVVTLRPSDGPLGSSLFFSRPARATDGSLWIPSIQGVTRIDPAAYAHQFERPARVVVEAIQTDAEEHVSASSTSHIRLPRGERSLSVAYTALDFTAPDLLRFRTQLVGLDATWRDQGTARSAVYGGLASGTYTFRVQARNGGGVWSDPVEATLVVPAYFYETGWFAFLCILGLLAALGGGLHLREQTQQRRRQHLEAVVDERTRQLQSEKETVASQARRLQTLDAAKSAFFSNVSHEFRTPLTLILGPLDDMKAERYGPLTAPLTEQVDLARRNARRMLTLINQILDVARLETGRTQLQVRPFELCLFVEGIADLFEALATRQSIDLNVDRPLHPVEVVADPMQLEKVVVNLLSNALKFTPTGGVLRVAITARHGIARISVQDSGPGIPADDIPHIFDRFYRVGGATQMHPGTGIGLALAKEIMDLHEGTLTVESETGAGSTFTLTLPWRTAHLAPTQTAQPADSWTPEATHTFVDLTLDSAVQDTAPDSAYPDSDRTTILVVEDHPEVRAYIRRHLEQASGPDAPYRILEAADGEAGLALAKARLPDIVLSDIMMPTLNGMELCRALKSDPETDFIPVILLTAKAAPEDKIEGLGELADAYLTKPFDVAELQAHIANLIAVRTRLRERFQQEGMALRAGEETDFSTRLSELDAVASTTDVFLARVRETVTSHISDDTFSVQRLADDVGVSRGHLHRQLKALADLTPTDLIRTMRLEQAAHLLACRAGTVSEIAYAVGFKSIGHFSDSFMQAYGCRPSAYAGTGHEGSDEPANR